MRKKQLEKKNYETFLGSEEGRRNLLWAWITQTNTKKEFQHKKKKMYCVSKVVMSVSKGVKSQWKNGKSCEICHAFVIFSCAVLVCSSSRVICLSTTILLLLAILLRVGVCLKTGRRVSFRENILSDVTQRIAVSKPSVYPSPFCLRRRICSIKRF